MLYNFNRMVVADFVTLSRGRGQSSRIPRGFIASLQFTAISGIERPRATLSLKRSIPRHSNHTKENPILQRRIGITSSFLDSCKFIRDTQLEANQLLGGLHLWTLGRLFSDRQMIELRDLNGAGSSNKQNRQFPIIARIRSHSGSGWTNGLTKGEILIESCA